MNHPAPGKPPVNPGPDGLIGKGHLVLRGIVKDLTAGEPELLHRAEPGDVHIWVSVGTYGAMGASGGPNFYVGGPDVGTELGTLVSSNEWESDLEDGEEVWVMPAEDLSFTTSQRITATVRSVRRR